MNIDKKKLEVAMARAKLGKRALAQRAGLPLTTVHSALARNACRTDTAGRIAEAVGVDVAEILADE